MKHLTISNSNIYIDSVKVMDYVSNLKLDKIDETISCYTADTVYFCGVSGNISVVTIEDKLYKIVFNTYDNVGLYNVSNTTNTFVKIIDILKTELSFKYRFSKNVYFNHNFLITLSHTKNNISILISQRSTI